MVAPSRSWGDKIGATGGNKASTSGGTKNNFPGYRGPVGTNNADTSSAGVSGAPRNVFPGGGGDYSTGQTTSYGAPVSVNKYGIKTALPDVATPGKPAQAWGSWKSQMDAYNDAASKWNGGASRSFANLINALAPMGFSMQAPNLNRPSTYVGGDYHLGVNPGAFTASLLGSALGPLGTGTAAGFLGGAAYDATGLGNVMLGGGDVPKDWDPNGAAAANRPMSAAERLQQQAGRFSNTGNARVDADHLQNLVRLNQNVSGNPNAPQSLGGSAGGTEIPGPNYTRIMASTRSVAPGYGVDLPSYQYLKANRATV